jgi:hypothetical protein
MTVSGKQKTFQLINNWTGIKIGRSHSKIMPLKFCACGRRWILWLIAESFSEEEAVLQRGPLKPWALLGVLIFQCISAILRRPNMMPLLGNIPASSILTGKPQM